MKKQHLQVSAKHYNFESYMHPRRWMSIWHQLSQILRLSPRAVLELGPGSGYLSSLLTQEGISVTTVDIDEKLNPTFVGDIRTLSIDDNSFDIACAFQVLEHVEYSEAFEILSALLRVSSKYVIISVPNLETRYPIFLRMPKIGEIKLYLRKFFLRRPVFKFDGQHYWELNSQQVTASRFKEDLANIKNARLLHDFRAYENSYHHFFIIEKLTNV